MDEVVRIGQQDPRDRQRFGKLTRLDEVKRRKDGDAPVPYGPRRRQFPEEHSVTSARAQMRTDDMFSGTVH